MPDVWTILTILKWTAGYFKRANIESARLDAELLLAHVLGQERTRLYMNFDKPLLLSELEAFKRLIQRRARREPVAYITGKKEFWSLDFTVNKDVLIPRPETELLIQTVIELQKSRRPHPMTILDIGTGSGNIAISLASELPEARILAGDISAKALQVAQENARLHKINKELSFYRGDLFGAFKESKLEGSVDFVVSNPPYIPSRELAGLEPEIDFEPRLALDGGSDGVDIQQRIIQESLRFLSSGGYLVMETGITQARELAQRGRRQPEWVDFKILPDYSGLPRVVVGRKD